MSIATADSFSSNLSLLMCQPRVLADLIEACLAQRKTQVLADIVLQDAPLAVRLLQAATKNGIFLDGNEPVSSAIHALGREALTSLALHATQQLSQKNYSEAELLFQYRLWTISQIGAIFARCLAPSVNFARIEEAQLCGLLLNLGSHLLFHTFGKDYLAINVSGCSSQEQVDSELQNFGIDHLSLADQMISPWHLDSFLADAVRFLYADINHIEDSNLLLKIARQAQQFCLDPEQLTEKGQQLAERLLRLKASESHYLFHWGKDLYPSVYHLLEHPAGLHDEFQSSVARLQQLSFLLAGQEATRARLAKASGREDLLLLSRQLLLEQSPAREVFFFLLDNKSNLLTGMLAGGQHRLVKDLEIPLRSGYSLVSDAYLKKCSFSSFSGGRKLTVTDNLLLRLCDGKGFFCSPLQANDQLSGVVVLKLSGAHDLPGCDCAHVQGMIQIISRALLAEPATVFSTSNDISGLLYQVSQDVKNPLTIINNYIEVISQTEKNPENQALASAIKGEVRRIDSIFNEYLSRHDEPEFFDQGIDLNQLIREVTESLGGHSLDHVMVSFDLSLQERLDRFQCNPTLIRQILTHLVKNAIESFNGEGVIKISTRLVFVASRQWQVELVIQDNGPGLPVPVQKNLFKPVFSNKGTGHAGVGLNLVNKMVTELDGQIGCYSSAMNGTCFTIQLPYRGFASEQ